MRCCMRLTNFLLFVDMTLMVLRENVNKMRDEINAKKMNEKRVGKKTSKMKNKLRREEKNRIRSTRNSYERLLERKRDHGGKAPVDTHTYICVCMYNGNRDRESTDLSECFV